MLYVKPNYYHKFKCTADKCEATCCAGWQIAIDEESLARYHNESDAYGDTLRERINWSEGVFKQDACKRCAFLNADNLCDMYKHLGEESLCVTCTNYPRHIEEFENLREITLSISCPEVASIILSQSEPVTFYEEECDGEEEEFEDFDPFFFSYLEDARAILLSILQNRALHISVRTGLVLSMVEEMQEIIRNTDLFELADVFEKYEDAAFLANAMTVIEKELQEFHKSSSECFRYSKAVFGRLYELEHLSDDWEAYLEECWKILYEGKAQRYQEAHEKFWVWCSQAAKAEGQYCDTLTGEQDSTQAINLDTILEQLLVYFIFTYFCGAVYDDNVLGKVRMSVDSVNIIYEMIVAKWIEQKGMLSQKDIERIVYRYSRELEHSDLNLELMEALQ